MRQASLIAILFTASSRSLLTAQTFPPGVAPGNGNASASAEDSPADQQPKSVSHPRVDLAIAFNQFRLSLKSGSYPTYAAGFHPSSLAVSGQFSAGFYWTAHLKTELEFAWMETNARPAGSTTGGEIRGMRTDIYDRIVVATPAYSDVIYLDHSYQVRRQSVAQLYQFRDHRAFQPYLGASFALDRQTDTDARRDYLGPPLTDSQIQGYIQEGTTISDVDIVPASFPGPRTTMHAHVFARAGFKLFIPKRVFIVVEGQAGTRVGPLRVGLGFEAF